MNVNGLGVKLLLGRLGILASTACILRIVSLENRNLLA